MKKPLAERQLHLRLEEPCIERGGNYSLKSLIAHVHDTTIPNGMKIYTCHACLNAKCSNPNHIYWGTASENSYDSYDDGRITIWDAMVKKYGLEEAKKMQAANGAQAKAGSGNKGKAKSAEHRKKISDSLKKRNARMLE